MHLIQDKYDANILTVELDWRDWLPALIWFGWVETVAVLIAYFLAPNLSFGALLGVGFVIVSSRTLFNIGTPFSFWETALVVYGICCGIIPILFTLLVCVFGLYGFNWAESFSNPSRFLFGCYLILTGWLLWFPALKGVYKIKPVRFAWHVKNYSRTRSYLSMCGMLTGIGLAILLGFPE